MSERDLDQSQMADSPYRRGEEVTGRKIIIFKEQFGEDESDLTARVRQVLRKKGNVKDLASTLDVSTPLQDDDDSLDVAQIQSAEAVELDRFGMAIVSAESDAAQILTADASDAIEAVVDEKIDRLFQDTSGGMPADLGVQLDAAKARRVGELLRFLLEVSEIVSPEQRTDAMRELESVMAGPYRDTAQFTWGLQATKAHVSRYSGRGVRVAILDTGFALGHPDFAGRRIIGKSFVPNIPIKDVDGHGTHCIGTACGSQRSNFGPRYGVAYGSEIFVGKVFNNDPLPGAERGHVITAMGVANRNGCKVISLSLGSNSNGGVDLEYERAIAGVRRAGSLVVAATGNKGNGTGSPASSPSAMAVGALNQSLGTPSFSCRGKVEIAGPGVSVRSSYLTGTRALDGTSMATPHVAGVAALWLEAMPHLTPDQLESQLQRAAQRLPQSAALVGAGLVQAP